MAKKKLTSTKARKILHDKEVHGHPLTDKQRRFFGAIAGGAKPYKAESGGWLDKYDEGGVLKQKKEDNYGVQGNYNNYDISLPDGFKGWAYNLKGRNYSPAWGGQFQMGGSLPGAVGFTYARTAGAAPANGPYAKKTKASAQDGEKVMKGKEYVEQWMNSPMYKQMLEKSAQGPEFERINTGRISNLSIPTNVSTDISLHGTGTLGQKQHRIRTMFNATVPEREEMIKILQAAVDNPKDKEAKRKADQIMQPVVTGWNIGMNPVLKPGTLDYEATLAHEYGHTTDDPFVSKLPHQMSKKELMSQDLLPYIPKSDIAKMQSYYQGKVNDDLTKYVSKPQETRQYLTSLRYLGKTQGVYDPFTEKITPEQYKRIKPTELSDPAGMLRNIYTDEQIIDMLNSISRTQRANGVPVAQNGQEMKYYQEGLDFKPKTISQDGSNLRLIPRATGDLRGPKIDPRFAENVAAAKDRDAYSTFEELRSTPGLKLYSDEELAKLSKQDPSKWSKHVKQEYGDRQSKKALIQAHPDYNPEMSFEDQEALVGDKSLRARVLRGKNLLTGSEYGPAPLAIANQIVTAPANLVSNLAFNPYEKYIRPGAAEGLTNVLSDVMDAIDPVNPGTFMKAALKAAPKTALKLSTALPFYKVVRTADQAADASKQAFKSYIDRTKDLLEQPSSKEAFKNLADKLSISRVRSADPSYVEAINDPTLPIEAVDKMVASLTALDPSEFALSKQQAKYTKELGSLATDMKGAGPVLSEAQGEQVVDWLTTNASNMSPRDLVPLLSNLTQNLDENSKLRLVKRLYDSRVGAASANPMARYTAAQDLFSLAENYQDISQVLQSTPRGQLSPNTFLGKNIATNIKNIINSAGDVRPVAKIDDPYFDYGAGYLGNAQEIFHSLFRNVSHRLPTQQERTAAREYVTKRITERTKDLFNKPLRQNYQDESDFLNALSRYQSNVGRTFVGAHSMSTDSYELAQRALLMKDRLGFDILPIHGGTASDAFPSYTNTFGGITRVGDLRSSYLEDLNKRIGQSSLKSIDPASQQAYMSARYSIDPVTIHRSLVESAFTNSVNAELNRQLGTNIPAAVYEGIRVNRPLLGFVPKKDGGDIPVDPMGYWNPENVGGPVTIPSNVITMKGVDQPLLGISDTGDVQYMMPGEDYEFDGEYVTEYPMAKKGISVNNTDAQPLKKLDQLLNFTNYNKPTKGGWLDKYQ